MRAIKGANLVVVFLLELGVLVGVGIWGSPCLQAPQPGLGILKLAPAPK
ncbi:hypothetical protein ACLMAL_32370 [Nocardia sp. CWNU-33]